MPRPHVAVGALNPNGSVALFSNIGEWVHTYAPGAAVLSASPPFNGGVQAGSRADRLGMRRETIDPDDFSGGFALWSGTSFAAPYVAGRLAQSLVDELASGQRSVAECTQTLADAREELVDELEGRVVRSVRPGHDGGVARSAEKLHEAGVRLANQGRHLPRPARSSRPRTWPKM